MKKLSLFLVVIALCYSTAFSQEKETKEPYKQWEIGGNLGISNFSGSYNMAKEASWNHFNHWSSDMNLGYGLFLKKNLSHVFALEAAWNATNLTGSWKYDNSAVPNFKTGVNEFDLNTVWNINNLFSKNKFDRKVYWYAKLGVGATHLNAKASVDGLHGDNWKVLTIPVGTGVAFRLSDNFKMNVGTQWSWVNTDQLDGRYTRGITGYDPKVNGATNVSETYLYTHVGLAYVFGKKKAKPQPVVVAPEPEKKPEPKVEPKVEPKPAPAPVKPAVIGNAYKVYFGFDKWDLNSDSRAELDRLARDMNENSSVDVQIKSHTDSRGPASYNMKLSEKRSKSVIDYLVSKGISASRINAQALGETQPVNKCVDGVKCTEAEHKLNRRTETLIIE